MQTIMTFHNSKWFYPLWALFFTLSLILLWWRRKDWQRGYLSFFWLIVGSMVIVYCPLVANILVPRFLPSWGEYERIAWVFFELPLICYIFIKLSDDIKEKKNRYLFIVVFIIILVFFGSPDNRNYFAKPQNRYKISQDAVTICDRIDSLSPDGQIDLCVLVSSPNAFKGGTGLDGTLYYGIRTYASRYTLRYVSVTQEEYSQENYQMNVDIPADTDYFICPKSKVLYRELDRLGYSYIDESEHYSIFKK